MSARGLFPRAIGARSRRGTRWLQPEVRSMHPPGVPRGLGRAPACERRAVTRFAEVAVTLPVAGRFHYLVPEHLAARALVGARVLVRFGGRKVTGVVVRT